jgi:hypothetical protein
MIYSTLRIKLLYLAISIESTCSAALTYLKNTGTVTIDDAHFAELKKCQRKLQAEQSRASVLYDRVKPLQDQLPSLITAKEKDQSDDENNFLASEQMTDDASPTQLEGPQPVATDSTADKWFVYR